MEMEQDFDGEIEDVDNEDRKDEDEEDETSEPELDRQMGEVEPQKLKPWSLNSRD